MAAKMADHASIGTSSDSEDSDLLNPEDGEGWEDAEPDEEETSIMSLFGDGVFPDVHSMLRHCKDVHAFDFLQIRNELGLDFFGTIKFINYIRSEVKGGNRRPDVSSEALFQDDRFLRPVLEDDALLYSLNDLEDGEGIRGNGQLATAEASEAAHPSAVTRVIELQEQLQRLQEQFAEYRLAVSKTLDDRWNREEAVSTPKTGARSQLNGSVAVRDDDSHYFTSYSYNEIHETMLKDTVRTDAYRDFIYDHKYLFENKVVLDVGCGTGILSMFCARAGASRVIAVDNSDIIDKARENIYENGLDRIITCLRGKIEDVTLPVQQVDIIVSEWMGYCLLYEAMLDSVLWARDRYLTSDGLMIPSHTTLHMAPLTDPDYIADHISFWQSVYGFNMNSMLAHIYDEVLIRDLKSSILAADSVPFLQLPLHHTTKGDLTFADRPFTMELKEDIDALDGFVIWFDTFFLPARADTVSASARAEDWGRRGRKGVAFTTGPGGPETHWRQGLLLIDHGKREPKALKKGQVIRGKIGYKKREDNSRELDIEIVWDVAGSEERGKQLWFMR